MREVCERDMFARIRGILVLVFVLYRDTKCGSTRLKTIQKCKVYFGLLIGGVLKKKHQLQVAEEIMFTKST